MLQFGTEHFQFVLEIYQLASLVARVAVDTFAESRDFLIKRLDFRIKKIGDRGGGISDARFRCRL